MKYIGFVRTLRLLLCLSVFVFGGRTPALLAQDSWNPPPKSFWLLPLPESHDGSQPQERAHSNLGRFYSFWIWYDHAYLMPFRGYPRVGAGKVGAVQSTEGDERPSFPEIAHLDGYGVNYVKIPKPKTNCILPILGYLFYVRADAAATDEYVKPCEVFQINPSDEAYTKLGFRKEQVYSFPRNDFVAQWYDGTYSDMDRFPGHTSHILRGHGVLIRKIKRITSDQGLSSVKAEIAVVPPRASGELNERDFKWYSVGDELAIPWAFSRSSDDPGKYRIADRKYYKITNIVLPDSPTIQVQPEDGGEPIECKPIGWVDIDIHGREEPAGKKE